MADTNRDIFIALIDAGLDESTVLAFVEGSLADAAPVVAALGTDAHLAELVWALRADRQRLAQDAMPTPSLAETEAAVDALLDQELAPELDASAIGAIEEAGLGSAVHPPVHPKVRVRRVRHLPKRTIRVGLALAAAAAVVVGVSTVLPRLDFGTGRPEARDTVAQGERDGSEALVALADSGGGAQSNLQETTDGPILPGQTGPEARELERPVAVASAEEALLLAREGRLVIRLVAARASAAEEAGRLLAGEGDLTRFAAIEGRLTQPEALALGEALPVREAPVIASADPSRTAESPRTVREARGSYMLRVEPSERAVSMLIARLRSEPGIAVELIGTPSPVATPASARDLASLSGEPSGWRSRISVPVVVEEIR